MTRACDRSDPPTAPAFHEEWLQATGNVPCVPGFPWWDWLPYKLFSDERNRAPGSGGLHEMHALPC
jgi:hypothetical protein